MGPLDIFNHTLNFMAPAAAVALLLVLCGRLFGATGAAKLTGWRQFAVVFVVGLVVLAGGLALWGRDGKMLTYAALVVATATCQWVLVRGWKG
ncbi:MAG: hypothetical protein IV104_16775 [Acidovorax sp.]|nr:hypothetical protein [Acidovorax sp.]